MVGVPGRSKGCTTCRRRKLGVSTLSIPLHRPGQILMRKEVRSPATVLQRNALTADESAKVMPAIQSFSIVQCNVKKVDMASKKLKPLSESFHSKRHLKHHLCNRTSISKGVLWKPAEPMIIECLFSQILRASSIDRCWLPFGRSISLRILACEAASHAFGWSKCWRFLIQRNHFSSQ